MCDLSMILTLKYDDQLNVGDITWSTDCDPYIGHASCDKLCITCIVVSFHFLVNFVQIYGDYYTINMIKSILSFILVTVLLFNLDLKLKSSRFVSS